jgi:hypothetical protein
MGLRWLARRLGDGVSRLAEDVGEFALAVMNRSSTSGSAPRFML